MFDVQREEIDWCGRKLVLETGRIARQADGAVYATWGETTVLATVVALREAKPGQDFFPLTVHYQEKTFAAGRIPGGYLKREGRPSERETLTSRLIDRPIRPLFPDEFRCETQIIATVLSYDLETDFGHPGDGRLVRGAHPVRRPLHGSGGSSAGRLYQGRGQGQPDGRGDEGLDPRSRRRRHRGRGSDGRIGSPGAVRRDHAERGHGRPRRLPAGDPGDHPSGRKGRQGTARSARQRSGRRGEGGAGDRRGGTARRLFNHREAAALRCRRRRKGESHGGARPGGRRRQVPGFRSGRSLPQRPGEGGALEHPRRQAPDRRPRSDDRPSDCRAGRRPSAHPRIVVVHPRRDAGARRRDPRHW